MLKLGKLTDYAIVVMTVLAAEPDNSQSAHELARLTHVAEPTVGKVLKLLGKSGLVSASRGASGGYRLSRDPAAISIADVVRAMEGPIGLTECSAHGSDCAIEPSCGVRGNWRLISDAIREALGAVTLEQMAAPMASMPAPRPALAAESPLRFHPSA